MPLVAHNGLPSFQRLREEKVTVLPRDRAEHQDIRELHIGLLNMMPDKALEATERQFFRLVGESNQIAQFYLHPFTVPELERGAEGRAHIESYYETFEQVRSDGLDALIITGANVVGTELASQPFWKPLNEVIDWAYANVTSTLCSCLATHAVLQFRYRQKRKPLPAKRWGVFPHRVTDRTHPLVSGINTSFDVPHSRFNEVERGQFEAAGLRVLVESDVAGVHLAVSEDGFRIVFFQGHPEYDAISLMKEYKREVGNHLFGQSPSYPPFPENCFTPRSRAILEEFQDRAVAARVRGAELPAFPEELVTPALDNTWRDSAESLVNKWIGMVYQLTHVDRRRPFRDGVDPANPLMLPRVRKSGRE